MLVGAEVTLAFVLAAAAILFARTVVHLQHVDLGLVPDRLVAISVSLDGANQRSADARTAFYAALAERVAALPGVSAVSAINHLPLAGDLWVLGYAVDGRPPAAPGEEDGAAYRVVLPRYFATAGQAIRAGRDFTSADRAGSVPVAIVNQHLADRQWPGQGAIGRRLRFGDDLLTVVGVVADVPQSTLVEPIEDELYLPLAQRPPQSATRSPMTLVVRTATDAPMFRALADAVWSLDRQAAVYDGMTLADVLDAETWRERLGARVGAIFAAVALLLAAVGISSVVRYAVTRRWREFGVRLALGATRGHVVSLAVREAAVPVVAGLAMGIVLVLLTARLLASLLVGVAPHDPVTIVASALTLLVGLDAGRLAPGSARVARRSRSRPARHIGSSRHGKVRGMSRLLIVAIAVLASARPHAQAPPTGSASPVPVFSDPARREKLAGAFAAIRDSMPEAAQADWRPRAGLGRDHRRRTGGLRRRGSARRGGEPAGHAAVDLPHRLDEQELHRAGDSRAARRRQALARRSGDPAHSRVCRRRIAHQGRAAHHASGTC